MLWQLNGDETLVRRNGTKPREPKPRRVSKYKNKRVVYDNQNFDSKAECQHYINLKLLKEKGEISDFKRQVPYVLQEGYPCPETGRKIRPITYIADFVVTYPDGRESVQDVKGSKGFMTEIFKIKRKMFMFRYKVPLEIVLVKVPRS